MGTRGLFGFYYKGRFYVVYNHCDSYRSGLGLKVLNSLIAAIKNGTIDQWKEKLITIKEVDEKIPPTAEDIKKLSAYTDLGVSTQSTSDWYCILRSCQGSIESVLGSGYILNAVDENGQPDFQEYAYIINFNTDHLDFYGNDESSYPLTEDSLTKLRETWLSL